MSEAILYDYWRSSASYRVRIALNSANIEYTAVSVDLVEGEQKQIAHKTRNPQGFVPVLEIDGERLTQSTAIIEYLNETRGLNFLPASSVDRVKVRALANVIAMEVHPICNPSVLSKLVEVSGVDGEAANDMRVEWMKYFIRKGLLAFEEMLEQTKAEIFCFGNNPGLADFCLIPQLYNAHRWGVDVSDLKRITRIEDACIALSAFQKAHPDTVNA